MYVQHQTFEIDRCQLLETSSVLPTWFYKGITQETEHKAKIMEFIAWLGTVCVCVSVKKKGLDR